MHLSHPLLMLAVAGVLWIAGHRLAGSRDAASPGFLGLPGSAYGSLAARLMRDSLHSYWHGGESATQARHEPVAAAPSSASVGVFARRATAAVPPPAAATTSGLEDALGHLARLEKGRTKRNSPFPTTEAHRRYLDASAFWRLRSAYALDRSDATLYEILHFQLAARAAQRPELREEVLRLADEAIAQANAPMAGFSAALTGAGAAINLLNDLLAPGQTHRDDEAIVRCWRHLETCLQRYRSIREQALAEGWWQRLPETRRQEVESHATLLTRIADNVRQQLPAARLDVVVEHRWKGNPLVMARSGLETGVGERLNVTRLAYLLSSAQLRKEDGQWTGGEDWYAYLDVEKQRTSFRMPRLPRGRYTALRFDLGVDAAADSGDAARWSPGHPLNPDLNALHWSWRGGYVYLAIEGHYARGDAPSGGYSYHLAGQPCRVSIEIPVELNLEQPQQLRLHFDVDRLFSAIHPVRIADADSTHSQNDGGLAVRLAQNAAQSFGLLGLEPVLADDGQREVVGRGNAPASLAAHVPAHFPLTAWPEDNPPSAAGVALGRRLFEDKRLSINNRQSCASCHHQQQAFAEPLPTSVGAQGQAGTRNAMPLFNLAWKPAFFWDGRSPSLRDQVLRPIQDPLEMNETLPGVVAKLGADASLVREFEAVFGSPQITPDRIARALEQFLLTLLSGQSKLDLAQQGKAELTEQEKRGFQLFFTESDPGRGIRGADCFHCHGGAHFTNNQFLNNGLDSEKLLRDLGREKVTGNPADRGKFMVPSLRNVALTAPYMHDGRFQTLEEVVEHYDHGIQHGETLDPNLAKHLTHGGLGLTPEEKQALVAFLKTLTDESFIAQPSVLHAR